MVLGQRSPQFQRGDSGRETVSLIRPPRPIDDELSRRVGSSTSPTVLRQFHTAWLHVKVLQGWAIAAFAVINLLILFIVVLHTSDARKAVNILPTALKINVNMTACARWTTAASNAKALSARCSAASTFNASWLDAADAARPCSRAVGELPDASPCNAHYVVLASSRATAQRSASIRRAPPLAGSFSFSRTSACWFGCFHPEPLQSTSRPPPLAADNDHGGACSLSACTAHRSCMCGTPVPARLSVAAGGSVLVHAVLSSFRCFFVASATTAPHFISISRGRSGSACPGSARPDSPSGCTATATTIPHHLPSTTHLYTTWTTQRLLSNTSNAVHLP